MKKLFIFLALIVLLAGGAFFFLTGETINVLIKEQIEKVGTEITEQSVTVEKVDMKLLHGAGTINGLVINNPDGFSSTPLFSLNEVTLDINIKSLSSEPIVIDAIVIKNPEALVEFNETAGTNIQEMLKTIEKNTGSGSTQPAAESSGEAADPLVRVKKFVLAGVALEVDLTDLGNKSHKKVLPDITMSNLGGDAGLPASQLGAELIKRSLSSIWKEAKAEQEEILKDKLKDKAIEEASGLFDKLTNKG